MRKVFIWKSLDDILTPRVTLKGFAGNSNSQYPISQRQILEKKKGVF